MSYSDSTVRFRIGVLDIAAAVVLLFVIVLPGRASQVEHAYEADDETLREIALYQARLAVSPGDAEAAAELAELLSASGQTDWAVQVAGEASKRSEDASWRALLAISTAHAERIEVRKAFRYAGLALEACGELGIGPDRCPAPEHARMSLYFDQLEAGVRSGINPRVDPEGFQEALLRAIRMVRIRGATPPDDDENPDESQERDQKEDKKEDRKED